VLGLIVVFATALAVAQVRAQATDPVSGARARVDGAWLRFDVGADETAQSLQLRIWGTLREPTFFSHGFQQLDDDPELEYVVISRNEGTGPYYKLQILDLRPHGILTWSYDSYEPPTIARAGVELGSRPEPGRPSTRVPYRLTPQGLERGSP